VRNDIDANRWNVYAGLVIGPPVLNATPFYQRREEWASSGPSGATVRSPTLVNQSYGVYMGWNPYTLPLLNLRYTRNEDFDSQRAYRNTLTDEVVASVSYLEVENLALRYALRWSHTQDRIGGTDSSDLSQGAQVTWGGSFLERRLTTNVNYNIGWRSSQVNATGTGTVLRQQFPVAGLSLVETFPSVPNQDTLAPNPALIDGDVTAGAGIDIGFGPTLAGDQNLRDMGVQFPNPTTEVNLVWLWVDRPLPPAVAASYTFTAWVSDDNVIWTQIPLRGMPVFATFQNRFEIPVARTAARYVKVVTRPLAPSTTVDPQFNAVLVTELQTFLEVPASEAAAQASQWGGNLGLNARLLIVRDWNFTYSVAWTSSHQNDFVQKDWALFNSLGASKQLTRILSVAAQVSRSDSAQTNRPHEAVNRWSAMVGLDPLTTLGVSFTYSGQYGQLYLGETLSNNVTLTGHLDPWQGVSLAVTAGYSWARDQYGKVLTSPNASVSLTLTPMQSLTITGTWGTSSALVTNSVTPIPTQQSSQLLGSVTFTPVRALFFSAGILRSTGSDQGPQTLTNFSAGLNPFAGGQLLLRFGYDESRDSQAKTLNRVFGPSLRWNIRSGTYMDLAYTWNDTSQPALLSKSQNLFATLFINFL
jgi:hypothetical protein